jgi:3-oxoacyl-[acyl-carrier protein] reductase
MKNLFDVTGKTILITGASRGIGKSLALGFRDAGAIVYGTGTKPETIAWMKDAKIEGESITY